MKSRPILFSARMVRALLDGSKTQTRRVVKLKPADMAMLVNLVPNKSVCCPYGHTGDRLWVRETFSKIIGQTAGWIETDYKATYTHGDRMGDLMGVKKKWTPSIYMPRDASRITLEITGVRVERLQDISETDAQAEGVYTDPACPAYEGYRDLWESINGAGSWDLNPWVWVIEFKRIEVPA